MVTLPMFNFNFNFNTNVVCMRDHQAPKSSYAIHFSLEKFHHSSLDLGEWRVQVLTASAMTCYTADERQCYKL